MKPIIAEPITALRTRTSEKWSVPTDVLPLPVAEMDYPIAPAIADVLHAAVNRSDTGYNAGSRRIAEAFAPFAQERFGWQVDPARVTCTGDVSMGLVEVLRQVTNPGDRVIITPPIYPPFFDIVTEASAIRVEVPLAGGIDQGWQLDLAGIEAAFAAGARAMLLCNPHNPTGMLASREQLETLADIAERHGATIVSDEVHGPLTQPGATYVPFLTVSDAAREVGVTVTAASKTFNIAGLKTALIVTASDIGDAVRRGFPYEVEWRASQFGAIATIAAFQHGGEWLDGVLQSLDKNRRLLDSLITTQLPAVRYRIPDATYLGWLDFSALGWGNDPAEYALAHAKVALGKGPMFGEVAGSGHVRLNFACAEETLREAVDRLSQARNN